MARDQTKQKIVYLIDHLRPDGTQRFLSQLVVGLAARGYSQTIICLNDSYDPQLVEQLRRVADVLIIGKAALLRGSGVRKIWNLFHDEAFDIAITLLFASDVIGRGLAKICGIPRIISSLRARNINYSWWQRCLVRCTMPIADAVVINSEGIRAFAIEAEGARPERIHYIPNGVDPADYSMHLDRALLSERHSVPREHILIGSVGRLTYQKGLDTLLSAVAHVPLTNLSLLIIGQGEEEQRLTAQAKALGIAERTHFLGYRRDIPQILGALDLYVHPARFEGMPNAILEAMAAGCPIVATAVDGTRELIEDGVHGWLVPPDNVGSLAQAITAAITDADEARRRGAAAHARVSTTFSSDALIDAWEHILQIHLPTGLLRT